MEISLLLTDEVDIEQERRQLQQAGMSWIEIKGELISKYREASKKSLFKCRCCNSRAVMVLNEDKSCFFRHESSEECPGTRNDRQYTLSAGLENQQKHRYGKAIIKDQLRSNLARFGAKVFDGYLYKADLSLVPDIIVEWPDGAVWSFDYVTGTKNETYQRYLRRKQGAYRDNGFKSYFFFDHSQFFIKTEQKALALSHAEKGALTFLPEHHAWRELLQRT
ncbi:MAG: hypothetical protein K0Q73_4034, partial [Paenibacillus sp.]|nr:hypothetical protein [Paenibacillus sp.]